MLGARTLDVASAVIRGAMVPLVCGFGLSIGAALLLSRLLTSLLYGISRSDPLTYCGAATLLLVTGITASLRPAWQAATSDPLPTLRGE